MASRAWGREGRGCETTLRLGVGQGYMVLDLPMAATPWGQGNLHLLAPKVSQLLPHGFLLFVFVLPPASPPSKPSPPTPQRATVLDPLGGPRPLCLSFSLPPGSSFSCGSLSLHIPRTDHPTVPSVPDSCTPCLTKCMLLRAELGGSVVSSIPS